MTRPLDKLPPYRCPASGYHSGCHWWQAVREPGAERAYLCCVFCIDTLSGDEIALWRGGLAEHMKAKGVPRG